MRGEQLLCGILMGLCSMSWAADVVDVHGLEDGQAQKWLQQYTPRIQALEMQIMLTFLDMNQGNPSTQCYHCLIAKKKQVIADIKHQGHFEFVDLQTVYYPKDKNIYTTLEIIDHAHIERMRFITKPAHHHLLRKLRTLRNRLRDKLYQHQDVVLKMIQYQALVMRLWLSHQLDHDTNDCPAYHCLSSFHHPALKPYLEIFQQGIVKDKSWIIATLRSDPDPERRAAAALLVGHFQEPAEIITLLSSCMNDTEMEVRNNILRVIATTLYKSHLSHLDIMPFIQLLDSPYVTDRNKALGILTVLADSQRGKTQIIQHGGRQLVALLHLTQPDNHDLAYILLQKVSHQHFGDHDYQRWQDWIRAHTG